MRKNHFVSFIVIFLLSLFVAGFADSEDGAEFGDRYWSLRHSDGEGLVIRCRFPDPEIKEVKINRTTYVSIVIPGLSDRSEPGQPQLPALTLPLFVPPESEIELRYTGAEETFRLSAEPVPEPHIQAVYEEETDHVKLVKDYIRGPAYDRDRNSFYPESPVRIFNDGYFRRYRLVTLVIEPVRVSLLQGRAIFHRDLEVTVSYVTPADKKENQAPGDVSLAHNEHPHLLPFIRKLGINSGELFDGKIPFKERDRREAEPHVSENGRTRTLNMSDYRIIIHETGMYSIDYNDLSAAGISLGGIDPRYLSLFSMHQEVAITIIGEDDGLFDPKDVLIFFGICPINEYSDQNTYWLVESSTLGLRMSSQDGAPLQQAPLVPHFVDTVRLETDQVYWSNIPNGEGLDHWFWHHMIAPASMAYNYDISFPVPGVQGSLRSWFQGHTYNSSINPDHHVVLELNGTVVDDISWDGQTAWQSEVLFSTDLLVHGLNSINCQVPGDTGSAYESLYSNKFEIVYPRFFQTDVDRITFDLVNPGLQRVETSGFSENDLLIYDVTDHNNVVTVINPDIDDMGGSFTVTIEQDLAEPHRYEMLTTGQLLSVSAITEDSGSTLQDTLNQADFIIIAPASFHSILEPVVQHRAKQGYTVLLADIQDVYDEFSSGVFSPEALTLFLKYAYEYWQSPAPMAVLFVGEANFDYFDHYGTGLDNKVPTFLIESSIPLFGETVSDHPASLLSGADDIPDIFIGRVTAQSETEVRQFVNKLIAYETKTFSSNWNNNVLLVADEDEVFEAYLDSLQTNYFDPLSMTTNKVYLRLYGGDVNQAKQDIISEVTAGRLLTIYVGHGSIKNWGVGLLTLADIPSFANNYKQTMVSSTSCLNGYFAHNIDIKSISEEWHRYQSKGALVVVSSTSLSSAGNGDLFNQRLLEQIFTENENRVGLAVFGAEIMACLYDGLDFEHMIMQSLLGDPLTMLRKHGSSPESIFSFDRPDYTGEADEAVLTVWDAEANQDPWIQETVTVSVSSASDPVGFSLTLVETSTNSGVFRTDVGSGQNLTFSTIASVPLSGILHVTHGEQIVAEYRNGFPIQIHTETAIWYLYEMPAISLLGLMFLLVGLGILLSLSAKKTTAQRIKE